MDKPRKEKITTILFIEQTRGGKYAAMLREKEDYLASMTGQRVKIVEKAGSTLKSLLIKADPFAGGKCGRQKCLPCESGSKDSQCRKRNILYESQCCECLKEGKDTIYLGESSRSAYERATEHVDS